MMDGFSPACQRWFQSSLGAPTPVQREGWAAISGGGSVLISAPTGTGKTLAAFLWAIDGLLMRAARGGLEDGVRVLYISPLKALGNDMERNLLRPMEGISAEMGIPCPLRAAVRNGDTTAQERRAMLRTPPHILITTPESLFIMLTGERTRALLGKVEQVIVDEIHAVMDSKRGAHLMMTLERLNELCGRDVPRIGLSATVELLDEAVRYLAGYDATGAPRPCGIVHPDAHKRMELTVELALDDLRIMPESSIWPAIFRRAYAEADGVRTTLAFCEGRATAEKLAHGVNALGGEGFALTHHGCISPEARQEAERRLKGGALRMMCATSSMELGIDVGEIDLVMQMGAPASVARAAQRLGRAGHRPDEVSRMHFFPLNAHDILLDACVARGVMEGRIERMHPPRLCLDVVAQQLVAMSASGEYTVDEALSVLRGAHTSRELDKSMLERLLRMLAGDYERAEDVPQRPRLVYDRINGVFRGDAYSRMLALRSGGTIPDRGYYGVYTEDGTYLGELDEEYVFEARLGDRFLLGAFPWQIASITRDRVMVVPCDAGGAASPFWRGDSMGRPYDAGLFMGGCLRGMEEALMRGKLDDELKRYPLDEPARINLKRHICEQAECGLPTDRTIVCERFADKAGEHQMLIHSVFGARVNLPLGMLLQKKVRELTGADVRMHYSDDGILLHSGEELPDGLVKRISAGTARQELIRLLPGAPVFVLAFRYNAMRALMMGMRGGGRAPLWVQRLNGERAYARALRHGEHPLLAETMRECMEDYMDCGALGDVLERIFTGDIGVIERRSGCPSPFAQGLRGQLEAVEMYDYSPTPSAAAQLDMNDSPSFNLDAAALEAARADGFSLDSADRLHEMLLSRGDMAYGESEAPIEWLEQLCAAGRAMYTEPGLWIAAEERELYERALPERGQGDAQALARVIRRCLRWHGPMSMEDICERYALDEGQAAQALETLINEGTAVDTAAGYAHRDVYERAQRIELRARRERIRTVPPENYAALLAASRSASGTASERLMDGLRPLLGMALPIAAWEHVLPALTAGYSPRYMDGLIASGQVTWRILPGAAPQLAFCDPERIDWDAAPEEMWRGAELDEDELNMLGALKLRGASFINALPRPESRPALEVLVGLCMKGLVVADSLEPLRAVVEKGVRRTARRNAIQSGARRWELAHPIKAQDIDGRLESVFDRYGIASRETLALCGVDRARAFERLRVMEYTEQVRRGYFVRGMSGAQFVRAADFERMTMRLAHPGEGCIAMSAIDPLNAWGALLKQRAGAEFLRVAGCAVVLKAGIPVLICEQRGRVMRATASECADEAVSELARAFRASQIYPKLRGLTVSDFAPELAPALERAGFVREMLDYVLMR